MTEVIDISTGARRVLTEQPSAAMQQATAAVKGMAASTDTRRRYANQVDEAIASIRFAAAALTEAARTSPDAEKVKTALGLSITASALAANIRVMLEV